MPYKKHSRWHYRSRKSKKKKKEKFRSKLSETTRRKWEHKSVVKKKIKNNLKMFYKAREKVSRFFDDYTTIVSKAK